MGQLHNRITHEETIDYIHSMLGQLRTMAKAERCDMLAYLIEMAYVEANDILHGGRLGVGELVAHQKGNRAS